MDLQKIDRLVAEKLMGTERTTVGLHRQERWSHPAWPAAANTWTADQIPHYSTDIAAALEVVEKSENPTGLMPYPTSGLGDWYGGFGVHRMPEGGWRAGHLIGYPWEGEHFVAEFSARADTAPLAICLAALSAVGCEVPE